jgi:elongation factor Ts
VVAVYVHGQVAPNLGRIGVLVALKSTGDRGKLQQISGGKPTSTQAR